MVVIYQNTKSGCPLILWKVHFKNNPEPVLMNFSVGPSIKANASEIKQNISNQSKSEV